MSPIDRFSLEINDLTKKVVEAITRIESVEKMQEMFQKKIFYGNGEPPFITQISLLASEIKNVNKKLDNIDKLRSRNLVANVGGKWVAVAALISGVSALVAVFIK